jgi:predicted nucleic acid-binding Zn ribbon protein
VRRRGPRPLSAALEALAQDAAPATLLARVQGYWKEAVGAEIAKHAEPTSERSGTLFVTCDSAAWANELELLAPQLLQRLNAALGSSAGGGLSGLRPKVGNRS